MDVEPEVDSWSSLLEIISIHCNLTPDTCAVTHTYTHTCNTDCLFRPTSPRVVTVIAYVIGLNEQNKNKLRCYWFIQWKTGQEKSPWASVEFIFTGK